MKKNQDSSDNFSTSFEYISYLNSEHNSSESILEIQSNSSESKSRNNSMIEDDFMLYEELSVDEPVITLPVPIPIPIPKASSRKRETTFEGNSFLDPRYLTPTPTFYENQLHQNMVIIEDLVNDKLQREIPRK